MIPEAMRWAATARAYLGEHIDAGSLGAFRVAFGLLMMVALVRFWAMGWIEELYLRPALHFTFWGFSWVRPLSPFWMYGLFAALLACAALVTLGIAHRAAAALFALGLAYVELLDATYYLNHYYAIVLIAALLSCLPADAALSASAKASSPGVPRAAVIVLRAQLGIIYFFAGVAKLNEDWLLRAEPLHTWLAARSDLPLLGPLLAYHSTAFAMSWAGALFDLTIPFLLLIRRARTAGYLLVIVFHLLTAALFRIGMFPWMMIALTPIFFDPDWPAGWGVARSTPREAPRRELSLPALTALVSWLVIQCALPLRHHLYPGDVLWTGEGMRLSWHVMIAERAGWAELEVVDADTGERWTLDPSTDLTPLQARTMAMEPDLLVQYAHHVRDEMARRGRRVEIYGDVWLALNGRPARRLIRGDVDLARAEVGLEPSTWILHDEEEGLSATPGIY